MQSTLNSFGRPDEGKSFTMARKVDVGQTILKE